MESSPEQNHDKIKVDDEDGTLLNKDVTSTPSFNLLNQHSVKSSVLSRRSKKSKRMNKHKQSQV